MQLTSILLYQNLKEHFQIADYRLLSKNQPLARPFFLEADKGFKNNHIYLTDAILDLEVFRSIPEDAVLIICQRDETSFLPDGRFSCLLLSCHTSVIHVFNCIQSIFDYYEEWEQQLISVCHQNGSLSDLLEISQPVFNNPLCIMNMDFSLVAHRGLSQLPDSGQLFENDSLRLDYIHALIQDGNFRPEEASPKPFLFPAYLTGHCSLNMRLFLDEKPAYLLSVLENKIPLTDADQYLITILAQHAEYLLNRMHSESSSRSTTLQSIFQSILPDRTADYMGISHLLTNVGWLPEHTYLCSVLQTEGPSSLNGNMVCQFIKNKFSASCSLVFKDHVVTFYNETLLHMEADDIFRGLVYFIRDSMLKAGYSRSMCGHMNLRRQYLQGFTALKLGLEIRPQLWIHHFNQIALPYILRQSVKTFPGYMLCYEKLLDLQKSDKVQNTEYMKTLRVYLEHNLNTVQSAKALFIHRSTFLYRLERIKSILETDLEDPDELFYLNLSFRLLEGEDI